MEKVNNAPEKDPRGAQIKRIDKALRHILSASEQVADMGSCYADFGNDEHEEYIRGVYGLLISSHTLLAEFREHM